MFSTKSEVSAHPMTEPRKNETQLHCNSLNSSDITDEWIRIFDSYSGTQTSQTALPAFGETFQNTFNSPKKQESPAKVEGCSEHANKRSNRLGTILPGVIRHTSHPERSLAYYYSDRGRGRGEYRGQGRLLTFDYYCT